MKASQRSGTHPLAKRLNVCYAVSMTDEEAALMQAEYEASQFTSCPQPLDFPTNPCHTEFMTYNRSQLIDALYREYEFLCHDDFDPDVDCTPAEYLDMLNTLSDAELVAEASDDDIDEFIAAWS